MIEINEAKKRINSTHPENEKNNDVTLNDQHGTPFVEIEGFKKIEGIIHGFTTKFGGVSEGIYESLNMGLYLGDEKSNVIENYKRITSALGMDYRRISCPNQLHHTNVLVVGEDDIGDGIIRELTHHDVDAQITNLREVPLIVYIADCVPILFADPVKKVIGSAHAGWRGTVAGMAAKTVEKMQEVYGCNPADIHAVIGPSIGIENYEVDDTVINELNNCSYLNTAEKSSTYYTVKEKNRYMFNLQKTNELILCNAGLKREHIYNTDLCTMEHHDIFFSHRYTNGKRGLNAGLIMLK